MKIVFFEIEDLEKEILLNLYGDIDYDTVKGPLTAENAGQYADAEVISTFVYSALNKDTLRKFKNLKLIATRSRTLDHIDLEYCSQNGIAVSNVPSYGGNTVAEHVFAMLLSLNRHIPQAVQKTKEGDFSAKGLQGMDLHGKTLGIIGVGVIGLRVAKIARGFGMKVIGYDIHPVQQHAAESGFSYAPLDKLLAQSDIISVHVGNTPDVYHILSEKEFSQMKKGVVIINTAVGAAIDLKALLQGLSSGKVHGACLDVLPDETGIREEAEFLRESFPVQHDVQEILASHALLRHKNVIVTPHIAYYTHETVESILRTTGDNIQAFLNGKRLNIANTLPTDYSRNAAKTG